MNSSDFPTQPRRRLLVDQAVQGVLLRRFALYGTASLFYCGVTLFLTDTLRHPQESISESLLRSMDELAFWVPAFLLLAPIFAYDLLRLTNRFVGPIFRLRRELRRLSNGEAVSKMQFREGDYWHDAADSFNRIREELETLRAAAARGDSSDISGTSAPEKRLFESADDSDAIAELLAS